MDSQEHRVDRSVTSGAREYGSYIDEEWDEPTHFLNDGRSDTRTTLYPWNADEYDRADQQLHRDPEDRRSWKRLADWNDGVGDSGRRAANNTAEARTLAQILTNQLDCTRYQTKRAMYIAEEIDFEEAVHNYTREQILLGIVSLIIDGDIRAPMEDWSTDDWILYDETFEEMMDAFNLSRNSVFTIRSNVLKNTEYFDL